MYEDLIAKVRLQLYDVSRLSVWSTVEEPSAFPLSTFDSDPQPYVTSIVEYLLTLLFELVKPFAEAISSGDDSNDGGIVLMLKVVEGTTALFMEQLLGIDYTTECGARQLSVDIEYLRNVISRFGVSVPPELATFENCFSTLRDELKSLVKSGSAEQLHLPTAYLVCNMRRVRLD